MVLIRENWQKQQTGRKADMVLLRTGLLPGTFSMFGFMVDVQWRKESVP